MSRTSTDDAATAEANVAEVDALRAEVARLRSLIGPSELSYDELRLDLLAARDVAKGAEAVAGNLRGRLAETNVALSRALQDQDHFQRTFGLRLRARVAGVVRAVRERFF